MLHAPTKMKSHGTLSTRTLAPALWGFRPLIGKRFSCIAVRMNRWRFPSWGSSSMNRTPWWASWIAPGTTRSYGWVPSCGCPPSGSWRTSPRSSVSLAPVARTNGWRFTGTRTLRGLVFSISRRFWGAFWSRTRTISPARSYTTTSSLPNWRRVVVTRSRPPSCPNVTSKIPPRRSPNGFCAAFPWTAVFGRAHFGHTRSRGDEYVPQFTHLNPRRSATFTGASFGSIRSPSAPSRWMSSFTTSSRFFTSTRGRSGFSGLWTPRSSSSGGGMWRARACAIIDFPVPGGPTRRKCRRCIAARRARFTASPCPITRARGSAGIATSAVVSISLRENPSDALSTFPFAMVSSSRERQVRLRVHFDPGRLLRDRAHLHPDDAPHPDFGGDVEDPLRDDPVEHDRAGLPVRPEGLHEGPNRDLGRDAVVVVQDPGLRGAADLREHVPVLLELRVRGPGGRGRGLPHRGLELRVPGGLRPRLDPRLHPGLRPGLVPVLLPHRRGHRGPRGGLGSRGRLVLLARSEGVVLGLVHLAREAVHLHELLRGDLVPQGLRELLLGELLDLASPRGAGDEVHLGDLEEFPQDEVPAAVPVHEGRDDLLLRQLLDRLRDVRPLDRDRVLDPGPQEVQDVLASLDDDDRVAVRDVRPRGEPLRTVAHDLGDLDARADLVEEVRAARLRALEHRGEELAGPLHDFVPLRDPDVLDLVHPDRGLARPHPVDRLQGRRHDRGLDLVEARRDQDEPLGASLLALYVDFDAPDPPGLLEVPEVELLAEQTFRLPEDRAYDVGLLDDALRLEAGRDQILRCAWIDVHVPFACGRSAGCALRSPALPFSPHGGSGPIGPRASQGVKDGCDEWDRVRAHGRRCPGAPRAPALFKHFQASDGAETDPQGPRGRERVARIRRARRAWTARDFRWE